MLTDFIAADPDISSMYIIGQDYSFGQVVSDTTIKLINEKRPDIEIVGNEFHPIGQVKDFTPYVTKIVSSGADAVVTGNFGADMVSLARSIIDSGLDIPIYTFYAAYDGITATLGEGGKNKIRLIHNGVANPLPTEARKQFNRDFKIAHPNYDVTQPRIVNALQMVVAAMEETQSTDPYDVALALEDMRFTTMSGEEIWMRAQDHQIFQRLSVSVHTDEGFEFDADNSGWGLVTEYQVPLEETVVGSSCQMRRPSR
jgi:branched-chain amino acid transport system substrate-binding protein